VTTLENRLGSDVEVKDAYQHPRGLNLTARTLASIIKYDKKIVMEADENENYKVQKGYYESEAEVVKFVKKQLGLGSRESLKTVECQIMDIADDIAYSAYDLEDTMEAGIVLPFDLMSLHDEDLDKIRMDVNKQVAKRFPEIAPISNKDVLVNLIGVFDSILEFNKKNAYNLAEDTDQSGHTVPNDRIVFVGRSYGESILHAENPLIRRQFLETLIQRNINAVSVDLDGEKPFMSKIRINYDRLMVIECLKAFNYHKVIATKKIQMAQYRSKKILESIFDALIKDKNKGYLLSDEQRRYLKYKDKEDEPAIHRFICDIIANFTDHEALQLFNKLNGNGKFFEYSF
jgi:dGTPase